MTKKFTKGFTLIELLVVIAIIGILSSVVLASLNTARGKGSDGAAKADFDGIRAQAEIRYDTDSNVYTNVCTDATVVRQVANASTAEGGTWAAVANNNITGLNGVGCSSASGTWVAWIALNKGAGSTNAAPQIFCVDNSGTSFIKTVAPSANPPVSCGATAAGAW